MKLLRQAPTSALGIESQSLLCRQPAGTISTQFCHPSTPRQPPPLPGCHLLTAPSPTTPGCSLPWTFFLLLRATTSHRRKPERHIARMCCAKLQVALVIKNMPANARDLTGTCSIPGSRRSPGEGHGNPLQYSCLENPIDRRLWRATVHGVAKKWLSMRADCKFRSLLWGRADNQFKC